MRYIYKVRDTEAGSQAELEEKLNKEGQEGFLAKQIFLW